MLTPQEVASRAFPKAVMGGYNMASVDEFLDELSDDYSALYKENAVLKSKLKVRVTMPDGDDFIAYQRMSTTGNLYMDEKENWEYFEQGTGCLVAHKAPDGKGFLIRYQGTLCASVRNPLEEKRQSIRSAPSTPQGFGRESSGPRTVE